MDTTEEAKNMKNPENITIYICNPWHLIAIKRSNMLRTIVAIPVILAVFAFNFILLIILDILMLLFHEKLPKLHLALFYL